MSKKKMVRPLPESLGLPRTGVETHAHLDMEPLAADMDGVLHRAAAAGVDLLGQVFLGPEAYERNAALFAAREQVFFLLGAHPHDAASVTDDSLTRMEQAFGRDERLKAMGEIGLDFYYDHSPRDAQVLAFRDQLALARSLDLPVVIHSRDAFAETLAILDDLGFGDRPLLWHCFGGDTAMAEAVLARGWRISLPGPVTYARNAALREAVARIPVERMVLETDCPYLAPEPWRGKTNEPALMAFTARAVAELKALDPAELWTRCGDTAREFFGLGKRLG